MLHPPTPSTLAIGFGSIGWLEISVLAVLGVLLFGKRLPEVGRSIGKGIVEFKKGLSGIEDDLDTAVKQPPKIEQHKTASMDEAASDTSEKTESSNQG